MEKQDLLRERIVKGDAAHLLDLTRVALLPGLAKPTKSQAVEIEHVYSMARRACRVGTLRTTNVWGQPELPPSDFLPASKPSTHAWMAGDSLPGLIRPSDFVIWLLGKIGGEKLQPDCQAVWLPASHVLNGDEKVAQAPDDPLIPGVKEALDYIARKQNKTEIPEGTGRRWLRGKEEGKTTTGKNAYRRSVLDAIAKDHDDGSLIER